MRTRRSEDKRRLRKQPKMRRMESAAPLTQPRLAVPKTAKRRRRRNQRQMALPLTGIKHVVFSARWLSLALLLVMVFSIYLTGQSEDFYLTEIPVAGASSIPAWEIVEASGLGGMHIFAANPTKAAAGITEVPGVVSASVNLQWPNLVNIEIVEDSPIAIWIEGDNQYWVTKDGGFIPARSAALGLLLIESELTVEEQVTAVLDEETTDEEAVEKTTPAAQADFVPKDVLIGALQLQQLRPNIEKLYFRPGNGLSYDDGRGWKVYFGTGDDMAQKIVVYEKIVEELEAQGITPVYISVSNQERPYYFGNQ